MDETILALVAIAALIAAFVWGRSARRFLRVWDRVEDELGPEAEATVLARSAYRKELHTVTLYAVIAVAAAVGAVWDIEEANYFFALVLIPVGLSLLYGRDFRREARLAEDRALIERRAEEVLSQEELAPRRWAARLAPEELPVIPGFELGRVYQAGTGMMAGDFYDVFPVAPTRVAAVIGDVTGHGIEPSITAFQAKYLLRVFLRQFRDPAQALEELNRQMSSLGREEEFISLCIVVFDTEAATLRVASAGHPPAWLWHEREVRGIRATGPLLMLDPEGTYTSREIPLDPGDLLLLYTDGLAEARSGDQLFGEERVANLLRRDPGVTPDVLCKSLLEAAREFATEPMTDDVAILAIRRSP
ncbi:MAG TPA: PP2C family protein-serine/threonine phosphatase [Acidimicrobiales bacterium]|nr:PP2C family protein-serine/threonine phosphatase [Acidimicrobiales bacterium]